jgi:type I restriction enzyme S subunit
MAGWNAARAIAVMRLRNPSDAKFVRYAIHAPATQHTIAVWCNTTVQATLNLKEIRALPIPWPAAADRCAIAAVLGALDDKIELNRRMNETLEELARTIFKSWFVDFDPVRAKAEGRQPVGMDAETAALFPSRLVESELGPIPFGWELRSLDAIARFRNGLALQNFRPEPGASSLPVIKIAQLRAGSVDGAEQARTDIDRECVVEDGDVLFSWSGSLLVDVWCGGRGALNQHLFKVTSTSTPRWFYLLALLDELPNFRRIAAAKATTMGHIQRHHLSEARRAVPSDALLRQADGAFAPLVSRIVHNRLESRTLAELRDLLLPKLISGELRVRTAEKMVEAAL